MVTLPQFGAAQCLCEVAADILLASLSSDVRIWLMLLCVAMSSEEEEKKELKIVFL